jgi:hypothetical protein
MHRGRNRSRKPVETQLVPHSQPPSAVAAVQPLAAATGGGHFQSHSLYPASAGSNRGGGGSNISSPFSSPLGSSQLNLCNTATYAAIGGAGKDLR